MKHDATVAELQKTIEDIDHDIEILKSQRKKTQPNTSIIAFDTDYTKRGYIDAWIYDLINRRSDILFQIERLKHEVQG